MMEEEQPQLLSEPIGEILCRLSEARVARAHAAADALRASAGRSAAPLPHPRPPAAASTSSASASAAERLWVDKYAPRSFSELLSDEPTNRGVLRWLKAWDHVVFGTPLSASALAAMKVKAASVEGHGSAMGWAGGRRGGDGHGGGQGGGSWGAGQGAGSVAASASASGGRRPGGRGWGRFGTGGVRAGSSGPVTAADPEPLDEDGRPTFKLILLVRASTHRSKHKAAKERSPLVAFCCGRWLGAPFSPPPPRIFRPAPDFDLLSVWPPGPGEDDPGSRGGQALRLSRRGSECERRSCGGSSTPASPRCRADAAGDRGQGERPALRGYGPARVACSSAKP